MNQPIERQRPLIRRLAADRRELRRGFLLRRLRARRLPRFCCGLPTVSPCDPDAEADVQSAERRDHERRRPRLRRDERVAPHIMKAAPMTGTLLTE